MGANKRSRSHIPDKHLRHAGQGIEEEINRVIDEDAMVAGVWVMFLFLITLFEWCRWLFELEMNPIVLTLMTTGGAIWGIRRILSAKKRVRDLKLGLDGERSVAERLESLSSVGFRVFHDVPGKNFNVDHVAIGPAGIFAVETKARSKNSSQDEVSITGNRIMIGGHVPSEDLVAQTIRQAEWVAAEVSLRCGKEFRCWPCLTFPGWFVVKGQPPKGLWVENDKALVQRIMKRPRILSDEEVAQATFHMSDYIKSQPSLV